MEENKNVMNESTNMDKEREAAQAEANRVKVLSPSQLVAKRFFRNKLAIVGLVILAIMFVFSFICACFSPYKANQVFKKIDLVKKDYATALVNTELRYSVADGQKLSNTLKAQFILARAEKKAVFEFEDKEYAFAEVTPGLFNIGEFEEVVKISGRQGNSISGVSEEIKNGFEAAMSEGRLSFEAEGESYAIKMDNKDKVVGKINTLAIASAVIFDAADAGYADLCNNLQFRHAAGLALGNEMTSFEFEGTTYDVAVTAKEGSNQKVGSILQAGNPVVNISDVIISPKNNSEVLTSDFKSKAREAISANGGSTFEFKALDDNDKEVEYFAKITNGNIYIKRMEKSQLIDIYSAPNKKHMLGTDRAGMDLMTRLMHGGRVSLVVGFVVIFIEMFIGIVIGGISGFFGGWVDMLLMRFVDLFNSIPYWPMLIIASSVMDALRVGAYLRLLSLMFILGFLGWTGVARIVRGQILTLREQEFMIACEANGIRTSRRIFRHLVPNVMPILIVQATMGLGSIIITEATLSFLGLGAKYPMASWGTIINASTDMYVMTNYWWIWVPAGTCILLTVLGFNFVGDGLRDAFDPKMKR